MYEKFNFHLPVKIVFGKGRIQEIRDFIPDNVNRILLVSEKNLAKNTSTVDIVTDQLQGIDVLHFLDVEENPSFETVEKAGMIAREHDSQLVIGIGGGSPMDAAKGIAMCATIRESLRDLINMDDLPVEPLPVICIPTTSETGSEVTPYAVFTDRNSRNKCGYANAKIFPQVALVDPELTYTMPERVTANTGMDVLTHSIEAFLSADAFPMNDLFAIESIQLVLKNLKQAITKDNEAMNRMAYASMLGGIAIAHSGTILLPAFLRFMREHSWVKEKVRFIDNMFNEDGGIEQYVNDLGISTSLSSYDIREEDIDEFVEKVIVKSDIKLTPAKITEREIREIYMEAVASSQCSSQ